MSTTEVALNRETRAAWRARHRELKREMARPLHAFAEREGWCQEFERLAMRPAGLPPREQLRYRYSYRIVGEDTPEAFERWRERAGRHLHGLAERYGHVDTYGKVILEAGFTAGAPRRVTVETTVTYRRVVTLRDGEESETLLEREPWEIAREIRDTHVDRLTVTAKLVEEGEAVARG